MVICTHECFGMGCCYESQFQYNYNCPYDLEGLVRLS